MKALIAVLAGDGIGGEVTAEAVRVLSAVAARSGHAFEFQAGLLGGAAIDATGEALPAATLALAQRADAILLGAVGGPKWPADAAVRPEQGLLQLRKALGLFANLRPVVPHPAVLDASPIKAEILSGVDIMVVRELTGGIYFGDKSRTATEAVDVCRYSVEEIERVVRLAAGLARARRRRLTSIDKANVLETSRLWRSVVERIMPGEFPDVGFEHMLVDAAAMHLLKRPRDFDVIVTENMFGDILTDEASMLAGSMGLLPSASLGAGLARRPVRAHPWIRAGHRRPRHRQSVRRDFERRAAAALRAAIGERGARRRGGGVARHRDGRRTGALPADLAAARPGVGAGITTRAAGDAVLAGL